MNLEIISNTVRDRDREVESTVRLRPGLREPSDRPTESELALITAQRSLTDARLQIARLADRNRLLQQRLQSLARAETLHQAAKRVIACITACRHGADEFVVVPPEADAQDQCANAERRIRARLAAPGLTDGIKVTLNVKYRQRHASGRRQKLVRDGELADIVMYGPRAGGEAHIRRAGRTSI